MLIWSIKAFGVRRYRKFKVYTNNVLGLEQLSRIIIQSISLGLVIPDVKRSEIMIISVSNTQEPLKGRFRLNYTTP